MTETLLSTSNILLFGRKVEDLEVNSPELTPGVTVSAATLQHIRTNGEQTIDGVKLAVGATVLVKNQKSLNQNGIYTVAANNWGAPDRPPKGTIVLVEQGKANAGTFWIVSDATNNNRSLKRMSNSGNARFGANRQLEEQLAAACFARIYGFSYEGTYYELPRAALFLVHGDGELVTNPNPPNNAARAPTDPSTTGVAAADFQFADALRVWSYDKADYTIRMDVETGMFEQVLLDMYFDGGGGMGGPVSGSRVAGSRVAGSRVAGSRVAGSRVNSPRGRGDPSD